MLHIDTLLEVLPMALNGWLGVFLVTAVVIASIYLLNWLTGRKK